MKSIYRYFDVVLLMAALWLTAGAAAAAAATSGPADTPSLEFEFQQFLQLTESAPLEAAAAGFALEEKMARVAPSVEYAELLYRMAELLISQSRLEEAEQFTAKLNRLGEHPSFQKVAINALLIDAVILREKSSLTSALEKLEQASQRLDQTNDDFLRARVAYERAVIHFFQGHISEALTFIDKAEEQFKLVDDRKWLGKTYNIEGILYGTQARMDESLDAFMQALAIAKQLNDTKSQTALYNNIALTLNKLDKIEQARDIYLEALALARHQGDLSSESLAHINVALVHRNLQQNEQALEHLQSGLELAQKIQSLSLQIRALNGISSVYRQLGNVEKVLEISQRALALSKDSEDTTVSLGARKGLAWVHLQRGEYDKALKLEREVLQAATDSENLDEMYQAHEEMAKIHAAKGDYKAALSAFQTYHQLRNEVFNKQSDQTISGLRAKFESQQQLQQIERLQHAKNIADIELKQSQSLLEQQQHEQRIYLAFLLLFASFAFLLYKRVTQRRLNQELSSQVKSRTQELNRKNEELQLAYELMEEKSLTDELTKLNNRRFLMRHIVDDVAEVDRQIESGSEQNSAGSDLLFFLIDVDHFKSVNDQYGHAAGDLVLTQVADLLKQVFRATDYLVRWGGEEFLVVMRHCQRTQAPHYAERLREAFEAHAFDIGQGEAIRRTCSIGLSAYPCFRAQPKAVSWSQVIEIADLCLYAAKRNRRNAWLGMDFYQAEYTEAFFPTLLSDVRKTLVHTKPQLLTSLDKRQEISWN